MVPPAIVAVLFLVVFEDRSEPKLAVAKEVRVDVGSICAAAISFDAVVLAMVDGLVSKVLVDVGSISAAAASVGGLAMVIDIGSFSAAAISTAVALAMVDDGMVSVEMVSKVDFGSICAAATSRAAIALAKVDDGVACALELATERESIGSKVTSKILAVPVQTNEDKASERKENGKPGTGASTKSAKGEEHFVDQVGQLSIRSS